jgi:hypothetical protein
MQQPETPHYHAAFPNPGLSVAYDKCSAYAQHCLRSFPHGGLKKWAEEQNHRAQQQAGKNAKSKSSMSYTALVSLKRGKLLKPAPLLVQRILRAFGYATTPVAQGEGPGRKYVYVFADEGAVGVFSHQLSEYEKTAVPEAPVSEVQPA